MKRSVVILVLACLWAGADGSLAQSYDIDWHSVDGGAGVSTGGPFVLSGTIGQPDAGNLAGGAYELRGGFWSGKVVPSLGEPPTLFIRWDLSGVTVSWSPVTPGFTLEMTEDIGSGAWDVVRGGDTSPTIVPTNTEVQFFRLVRP